MKKIKTFLPIVLALILTLCFSTVSYANTSESVTNYNVEQQAIEEVTRGINCPECGSYTLNITDIYYTAWSYTGEMTVCTTHTHCAIEKWSRTKMTTYRCSTCSYGFSITTPEYDYRHCSTY